MGQSGLPWDSVTLGADNVTFRGTDYEPQDGTGPEGRATPGSDLRTTAPGSDPNGPPLQTHHKSRFPFFDRPPIFLPHKNPTPSAINNIAVAFQSDGPACASSTKELRLVVTRWDPQWHVRIGTKAPTSALIG